MRIKIIIEFDLKNLFDYSPLKKRIKSQLNCWKTQFGLKDLKVEFQQKKGKQNLKRIIPA